MTSVVIGFDSEIFTRQRRGGISRSFVEMMQALISVAPDIETRLLFRRTGNEHLLGSIIGGNLKRKRRLPRGLTSLLWHSSLSRPWTARYQAGEVDAQCDVIHATFYGPSERLRRGARKMVVTVHDFIPEMLWDQERRGFLAQKHLTIRSADAILCVSEATASQLTMFLPEVVSRSVVVPLGVDADYWRPVPENAIPHSQGRPYILFVGARARYRGWFDLLSTFHLLAMRHPDLLLIAAGNTVKDHELEAVGRLSLEGRVQFQTPADDGLRNLYQGAAVMAIPSRNEGFCLPLLEAQACGAPIVCSDIEVLREVGGRSPTFVPPGRPLEFLDAIESVLEGGQGIADSRKAGLLNAGARSWRRSGELLAEVYRAVSS